MTRIMKINNLLTVAFRHNRIKNRGTVQKNTIPLHNEVHFEENGVKNLRFSSIFIVFYSVFILIFLVF